MVSRDIEVLTDYCVCGFFSLCNSVLMDAFYDLQEEYIAKRYRTLGKRQIIDREFQRQSTLEKRQRIDREQIDNKEI